MMVTTTLLVALVVVGLGVLQVRATRRIFDANAKASIEGFRSGLERRGELEVPLVARALLPLLIDAGKDAEIVALLGNAVGQDSGGKEPRGDRGLEIAAVLDRRQQVVAVCREGPGVECRGFDSHPAVIGAGEPVLASAWQTALARWRASTSGAALERFDLAAGGGRRRVFVYPIVSGDRSSAAAAAADEPGDDRHGYLLFGYDLAPSEWFAERAEAEKRDALTAAAWRILIVGVSFLLFGMLLAILQGVSIARPIRDLAEKADRIAHGDLDARVDSLRGRELGVLGDSFNLMASRVQALLHQATEKARLEQELEVARTIQETLVPTTAPITVGRVQLAGFFQQASHCGGDWWTWHDLGAGRVLVMIADVTGHGVPSAMITAVAKGASDVVRPLVAGAPEKMLDGLNRALLETARRRFTMTCFAALIDGEHRRVRFANAAHCLPYLYRGGRDKPEFSALASRGNRLGDREESTFEASEIALESGDVLVFFTDGLIEGENPAGEVYGERRLRAAIRAVASRPAADIRDALIAEVSEFFGPEPQKDDVTLVVCRIA